MTDNERKYLRFRSKGELVEDKEGRELTPTLHFTEENTMKTAPNKLTSKRGNLGEKG